MEFITDNGKIAAGKLLHQIENPYQRTIGSFDFDSREDAIELLTWFYRKELGQQERDTMILKEHIEQVIDWAMNPQKNCLMLQGGVGCGKTTMLNAFCKMIQKLYYSNISYERRGFQWETADRITLWAKNDNSRYEEFKVCEWAAIDDIGTEPNEITDYGNIIYPIRDILMYRYEHDLVTIISTNLTPKLLTEKYGTRIGDRLAEMMQMVIFNEASYRR